MKTFEAELVFPCRSKLGEGSLWDRDRQCLCWVDIYDNKVCLFDPARRANLAYDVGENVGTVVTTASGKLLVALRSSIALLDPDTGRLGTLKSLATPDPGIRCNDGKCDPSGRFWIGTMVERGPSGSGALYLLGHDLELRPALAGLTISNGLAWRGTTFYHIDTPTYEVRAFEYDASTGELGQPRTVKSFARDSGAPDGMCIDSEGMLWVALFGGRGVLRFDPATGQDLCRVNVPAKNVTSCAFGGPELDELYITTASIGQSAAELEAEPLSGSLFRVKLPYRGLESPGFEGPV